eukprot:gene19715-26406_t
MNKLNKLFYVVAHNCGGVERTNNYTMVRFLLNKRASLGIAMNTSTLNDKRKEVRDALVHNNVPGSLDDVLEWAGYSIEGKPVVPEQPLVVVDGIILNITVNGKRIRVIVDDVPVN